MQQLLSGKPLSGHAGILTPLIKRLMEANPSIGNNQPDNYVNWGMGFPVRLERLHRAA